MSINSFYFLILISFGLMSCESKKYAEDSDISKFELLGNVKSLGEYSYLTDSTFSQINIPNFQHLIQNKETLFDNLKRIGINHLDYTAFNKSGQIIEQFDFRFDIDQNIIKKNSYDKFGNKIKSTTSYFDENVFHSELFKYNKDKNVIEKVEFTRDTTHEFRRMYLYDERKLLIQEKHYNKDDELFLEYFYKYNSRDQIIEVNNNSAKTVFFYDDNTNLTEEISYDSDKKINKHYKKEYDSLSNIIKQYSLDTWLEINNSKIFEYDSNQNLIEVSIFDEKNNFISKQKSKYTSNGKLYNQTVILSENSPNPRKKVSRTFNKDGHVVKIVREYELDGKLDTTQNIINYTTDKKGNILKIEDSSNSPILFREIEYY